MLSLLRIANLAVVDRLEIEFGSGFNAITGETGSGKSILLKAIGLLCGEKSSPDLVRTSADRTEVEGLFQLSEQNVVELLASAEELAAFRIEDGEVVIRRVIEKEGKSRGFINGKLAPRSVLEYLGRSLVDVTGQHHQQRLLDVSLQRGLLDQFGIPSDLLDRVSASYKIYVAARKRLEEWSHNTQQVAKEIEQKRWELKELDVAGLGEMEEDLLVAEETRLGGKEELIDCIGQSLSILDGEDRAILGHLARLKGILTNASSLDSSISETLALVESASVELAEVKISLEHYSAGFDVDPMRLDEIRSRLTEISGLKRKYRKKYSEMISYREALRAELVEYDSGAFDQRHLALDLETRKAELSTLEEELTAQRHKVGQKLSQDVARGLRDLEMKRALFTVDISKGTSSATGADNIEFLISPNPGEEPKPLAKIASGGELSRVTLVLKSLLNDKQAPSVQIYDEVDSGVGGKAAQAIGEKLRALASRSQVIAVTHSPQVAAFADRHMRLNKESSDSSTSTSAQLLDSSKRVEELARMLAGRKISDKFLDSARELLSGSSAMSQKE